MSTRISLKRTRTWTWALALCLASVHQVVVSQELDFQVQIGDDTEAEDLPEIDLQESTPPEEVPAATAEPSTFDNDPQLDLPVREPRPIRGAPGDWNEAHADGATVTDVIRAHWIRLDRNGGLRGRISVYANDPLRLEPISGLTVRLIRQGQTMAEGITESDGTFELSALTPGVYTLVCAGAAGFAAYSLSLDPFLVQNRPEGETHVIDDHFRTVQLQNATSSLGIDAAAVPPTFNTLKRLVQTYYAALTPTEVPDANYQAAIREDLATNRPGAKEVAGPERRRGIAERQIQEPTSRTATSIRHHRVVLFPDGRMVGRLHNIDLLSGRPKLIDEVNVHLIQDDMEVARARVNRIGVFEIPDLEPGAYGLVAGGKDGFGAISFELVRGPKPDQAQADRDSLFRFLPYRRHAWELLTANEVPAAVPAPFAMALIDDPRDIRAAFQLNPPVAPGPMAMAGPPGAPMGGPGGGAPGGFSGGGGGGGGAGMGGLGLAGLVAAGLVPALIDDDDADVPRSPSQP